MCIGSIFIVDLVIYSVFHLNLRYELKIPDRLRRSLSIAIHVKQITASISLSTYESCVHGLNKDANRHRNIDQCKFLLEKNTYDTKACRASKSLILQRSNVGLFLEKNLDFFSQF